MTFRERFFGKKQETTDEGAPFNQKEREKAPFVIGKEVRVFRSNNELDEGWKVAAYTTVNGVESAVVLKEAKEGLQRKTIPLAELEEANREGKVDEFGQAKDFLELFTLLDKKGELWGSQKKYQAAELKKLINRARSKNPDLHLSLEVVPETGGLRQKVKDLIDIEVTQEDLKKAA